MARLIDADALKANFVVLGEFANDLWHVGVIRRAIDNAPTVDAVPVVHGRWIEVPSMAPEYACSVCGATFEWWERSEAHYCPNCGAKMDLEVE